MSDASTRGGSTRGAATRGGPRCYRRGDPFTHAVGEWPALEALRHRPKALVAVLLDTSLPAERRARLQRAAAAAGVPCREDPRTVRALRHRSDARAVALVRTERDALDAARDHLALVGTRDPGNLGVTLRTALGFDLRDVALIASPLDPWAPHVLRASQGARFALRVMVFGDWEAYRSRFPQRPSAWFAPPGPDRTPLSPHALRLPPPATLAFGPEWPAPAGATSTEAGDTATTARHAGAAAAAAAAAGAALHVSIPQHPDLESHNLAVAVGIALYALRLAAAC